MISNTITGVAELVDALGLGSSDFIVRVRVSPPVIKFMTDF